MKNLALSFFVFLSSLAFGQEIPYSFSYSSGDFEYLVNPIDLNGDEIWSDNFYRLLDLGFEIEVAGTSFDRIEVRSGGVDFYEVGSSRSRRLFSFYRLLEDRGEAVSESPVTYQIENSPTDAGGVFKIEWRNAGVVAGPNSTSIPEDFLNLQVWLHENSNIISIHFGTSEISSESQVYSLVNSSVLGIKLLIDDTFIGPVGDGTMPGSVVDFCEPGVCYQNISSHPEEGTIYWFTPTPIMVSTVDVEALVNVSVYPNPTTDEFSVSIAPEQLSGITMLRLVNLVGETIWEATNSALSSSMTVDVKGFPAGIYTLIIDHTEGVVAKKVVKK
ncbi:T9SS type A sorting domain-containing protein [Lewinella cohaerens]|uniref:T9SS type A sorting domain-containing protein n=1 Tax=Lewinella cohaerens TaxID=70995 RepID=UPI00037184D7|nr:T9SS type A sorting domain-containing protein [Lewinella cohaerens]